MLPGAEQLLFILKDAVLLILVLWIALQGQSRGLQPKIPDAVGMTLLLYALFVFAQAFNPRLPNILVGAWGVKAHLLYMGIIFALPRVFFTPSDALQKLEKLYPWIVGPSCSIAFLQVLLPAESFLNRQVRGGLEGIATFGEDNLVRVAGPFSYLSGMAAFVEVTTIVGLGLFLAGARSRMFFVGLVLAWMALPVTGSRSVITIVALGGALMIIVAIAVKLASPKVLFRVSAVMALVMTVSFQTQGVAWRAFQQRFEANQAESASRYVSAFANAFEYFPVAGLLGYGSGAANLGAPTLVPDQVPFSWIPVGFEEESGRIVLELGSIGWALSIAMRLTILSWALRLALVAKSRAGKLVAVISLPFAAAGLYQGNGVFAASYMGVAYWFAVALLSIVEREQRGGQAQSRRRVL